MNTNISTAIGTRGTALRAIVLVFLFVFPPVLSGSSGRPIELIEAEELSEIQRLNKEVTRLFAKVRQCAAAQLAPATECHCYYPSKLASTQHAYEQALDKYPEWEDRTLLWWDRSHTSPTNLHMGSLKDRIEQPCRVTNITQVSF